MRLLKRLLSLPIVLAIAVINLCLGRPNDAKAALDAWWHDQPLDNS